ncbi:DEAD/DEAH box helicase [Arthrospiribacter ruber]|uniref:DEAD/DEAH box helicase n=1 Tax=Arthrospiribacter ruber TaxID=2487934 RepID=A0A951IXQ9_9BACT|nr:DEAD/DEAH box helicase [Arthrospiribacter ruber]MBW3467791.1 DEAD/DEAH box helicase [Arthrospiribacter ruber]
MNFSDLGLSPDILQAIQKANYEKPYPIQVEAIPYILQKRDLLGLAQTGSGKTAAYILPILEELQKSSIHKSRSVPVLIIVPTRELAAQVEEVIRMFGKFLPRKVKSNAVFGGVSINPQMIKLNGTDILVATPGRLLDLIARNAISISDLKTLVLDEADKVLNLGFKAELDEILSRLPKKRQNLLFSATMEDSVDQLIDRLLQNPVKIEVKPEEITPELINQTAYLVAQEKKGPLLRHLIQEGDWEQVLVFASSIRTADNLTAKLNKNGIQAMAFHGDKSQGARTEALKQFKGGTLRVLVATDLAARGIDIQFLPHVVNFELPRSPKDYIHRIGRTGRAGASGEAISLITEEDKHHWKVIQKKMKRWVELVDTDNLVF